METLLPFLLTCLIIEATPGPNMGYLAVLSASRGRRAGFAAVAGVALGLLVVGVAAAYGAAVFLAASPMAYGFLRWGGVAYMLYLAWESWRPETGFDHVTPQATDQRYFQRGFLTNVLNPKAALFYVAVLPRFITDGPHNETQAIVLTLIYVGVATAIHGIIVAVAGTAQGFLNNAARRDFARKVFAVMLVGVAVWLGVKAG